MAGLMENLQTFDGQAKVAVVFAVFWSIFIEIVRRKLAVRVCCASWWPQARPNQINVMANFGFVKDRVTEDMAIYGFVWIITMCITHVVSASLMLPVVTVGWAGAGETGRLCFLIGTLSEVGFDIYDGLKLILLTFVPAPMPLLGPQFPLKTFILIGVFHHTTVLGMTIPMNLSYPSMVAYHRIAFSLLFSAGVCYLTGQYKFTLDGRTKQGLTAIKRIMALQFVMNWFARAFIWFPSVYVGLNAFHSAGDVAFFRGGLVGVVGMSLYNLVVVMDATMAFLKWLGKSTHVSKQV